MVPSQRGDVGQLLVRKLDALAADLGDGAGQAADFTPGERDYIRLEFDMSFSPLPSAAGRSQLKT